MVLKKIDDLEGNEILAKAIITWDYQVILQKGIVLRPDYIERLKKLGITEVVVEAKDTSPHSIVILRKEVENKITENVKSILERHTYQNNKELKKISKMADSIISNVLEDDYVIEKVYDIKERSADIYEHSINVCTLGILTSLKLKIDKNIVHDIGVGCLLHDIGLRYITVNYENRSIEEFSENEILEFRKHPIYGYSSLQNETWISNISKEIILYHHEKIDGSGFPLKKNDSSLECRIVSVCDSFDEMICGVACTKVKVYEAIEYIKAYKNKKFDSNVVDAFLKFIAVYPAGTKVITNEGEKGVVLCQNEGFQDRPVLKIIEDNKGNKLNKVVIKDMVKINHIFIDKVID